MAKEEHPNLTLRMNTMPGTPYAPEVGVVMEQGQVLLLWSRWGVEGIYTDPEVMARQYEALKRLRAYENEPMSFEVRYTDQVN